MLLNKLNKVLYQMININLILKLKMIKGIQFVIIFGIMEFKFLTIGKIINIKIHQKLKKEKILQKLCIKPGIKKEYQIKNNIMILIL